MNRKDWIVLFFCLIPVLVCFWFVFNFSVNVPYWDGWAFTNIVSKFLSGDLSFGDLFAQHNEHRLFFPRLILLPFVIFTSWNSVFVMFFNLSLLFFTLLVFYFNFDKKLFYFIPISFLLFNLGQYSNLLWAYQVQVFLTVLFSILAFHLLKFKDLKFFILSLFCGIVASFSQLPGLLTWPVGLIQLFVQKKDKKRKIVWFIFTIIVFTSYFWNFHTNPKHPSVFYFLDNPLGFISHFLTLLGNLFSNGTCALFFGIICFLFFLYFLFFEKKLLFNNPFWFSVALFSLGFSFITSIGRAGFGVNQALSSRYVTFTILFPISLYYFVLKKKNFKFFKGFLIGLLVLGILTSFLIDLNNQSKSRLSKGVYALLNYKNSTKDLLNILHPKVEFLKKKASFLEELNYSVFSEDYVLPGKSILKYINFKSDFLPNNIKYNFGEFVESEYYISINGWAFIEGGDYSGGTFLVLNSTNHTFFFETDSVLRKGVSEHFNLSLDYAGFQAVIDKNDLPSGNYDLGIYIIQEEDFGFRSTNKKIIVN